MESIHPTCSKCSGPNGRRHRWCRGCMRAYRAAHVRYADMTPDQRRKAIARATARVYKARGHLTPERCSCGREATQMHHPDYSRPLDVTWVCDGCHRALHARRVPQKR